MIAAQVVGFVRNDLESVLRVGDQIAPQVVFFGTEYAARDPTHFVIPIEVVEGFFFLMVALVMVGPGQELGRAFRRVPDRLPAYTLNILGSLSGILLFAACSWFELSPLFWFVPVVAMLGYFLLPPGGTRRPVTRVDVLPALALVLAVAFWTSGIAASGGATTAEEQWSPYYRVEFSAGRNIAVNLIGHQSMVSRDDRLRPSYAYAVPHPARRRLGRTGLRRCSRDRRGLGQRREPRAGLGCPPRRCGRNRPGDPAARRARSSGPPVSGPACDRAHRRRTRNFLARLPGAHRPECVCARRFARAEQHLQHHPCSRASCSPTRSLHGRPDALEAGRRVRDLFSTSSGRAGSSTV